MASYVRQARFSNCFDSAPRHHALTGSGLGLLVVLAGLLTAALLGRVYLQFAISDVRFQQHGLQQARQQLVQEVIKLQHENERFCDTSRLASHARTELGMTETDPRLRMVAEIPQSLRDKYTGPGTATQVANAAAIRDAGQNAPRIEKVLLSLADMNQAIAGPLSAVAQQ